MDNNEREGAELDVVLESVGNFSLIGLSGEVDVYSAPKPVSYTHLTLPTSYSV